MERVPSVASLRMVVPLGILIHYHMGTPSVLLIDDHTYTSIYFCIYTYIYIYIPSHVCDINIHLVVYFIAVFIAVVL